MIPFLIPCHVFIIPTTHRRYILPQYLGRISSTKPPKGCLDNFHLVSATTSSICVSIEFSKVPQVVISSWSPFCLVFLYSTILASLLFCPLVDCNVLLARCPYQLYSVLLTWWIHLLLTVYVDLYILLHSHKWYWHK